MRKLSAIFFLFLLTSAGFAQAAAIPDEKGFYSTQGLQPRIIPYTTEADAQKLAANGKVVYLFSATWCPTCKSTYQNMRNQFSQIPANLTIVLVNFDTQKALKQKYGVTVQHTFIQIDSSGKNINAWMGTTTVAGIVDKIK